MSPRALVPVALLAALTAVGAHLRIPLPYVPLTLQAGFVCLAGLLLGASRGAASQVVYLTAGLVGFPVFARGGGLHYVLEPTFGYLVGFVAGAWTAGRVAGGARETPLSLARAVAATASGLAAIYAVGVAGLYAHLRFVTGMDGAARHAVELGLAPLPKDLLVGLLAAWTAVRLARRLPFLRP